MSIFAMSSGLGIGIYLLLAFNVWRWKRYLACAIFLMMAGQAISELFFFLQLRTFPDGLLGTYDAVFFPALIALGWAIEILVARRERWDLKRWFYG